MSARSRFRTARRGGRRSVDKRRAQKFIDAETNTPPPDGGGVEYLEATSPLFHHDLVEAARLVRGLRNLERQDTVCRSGIREVHDRRILEAGKRRRLLVAVGVSRRGVADRDRYLVGSDYDRTCNPITADHGRTGCRGFDKDRRPVVRRIRKRRLVVEARRLEGIAAFVRPRIAQPECR